MRKEIKFKIKIIDSNSINNYRLSEYFARKFSESVKKRR